MHQIAALIACLMVLSANFYESYYLLRENSYFIRKLKPIIPVIFANIRDACSSYLCLITGLKICFLSKNIKIKVVLSENGLYVFLGLSLQPVLIEYSWGWYYCSIIILPYLFGYKMGVSPLQNDYK